MGGGIPASRRNSMKADYPVLRATPGGAGCPLYLEVAAVAGLYNQLKRLVTIVRKLRQSVDGRLEFTMQDNNGSTLLLSAGRWHG